jgi:hypothetical protein
MFSKLQLLTYVSFAEFYKYAESARANFYFFLCRMFRDELERAGVPNIDKTLRRGFQNWFRNHVSTIYLIFLVF